MSPAQLKDMAESLPGFVLRMDLGSMREVTITRKEAHGDSAGTAIFVNSAGNWKIQEM